MRRIVLAATLLALIAPGAIAAPSMTRSRARELAAAVNLTPADMPGFDNTPGGSASGEDLWGGKIYARCIGRKALGKALADVSSPAFASKDNSNGHIDDVQSEVDVMPNAPLARRDIALAKTARGLACLKKEIRGTAPPSALQDVTITRMQPAVPHGVGLHVVLTVSSDKGPITIYSDVLVIQERNVEAALLVLTEPEPAVRDDEDRLLGILQTRLDAQVNPNTVI